MTDPTGSQVVRGGDVGDLLVRRQAVPLRQGREGPPRGAATSTILSTIPKKDLRAILAFLGLVPPLTRGV